MTITLANVCVSSIAFLCSAGALYQRGNAAAELLQDNLRAA